jgi:AcrR family transcriptional regulator
MPKVLPQYMELRRRQILEAAAACFARRGFHQTTMHDICDQAELSPGALYRYFRSKEDLIDAMQSMGQQMDLAFIEEARGRQNTAAVLSELGRLFFLEGHTLPGPSDCALHFELLAEAGRSPEMRDRLRLSQDSIIEPFTDIIRAGQERGEVNPLLDPKAVARVMISLYGGFLAQRQLDDSVEARPYVEAIVSLFGGTFWLGDKVDAAGVLGHAQEH